MLVGILADSHDNLQALRKAVALFNQQKVSFVLHAGDLVAPFVHRALDDLAAPLVMVFGNNDGERLGLAQVFTGKIFLAPHELEIDGKKVLLLHEPHNLEAISKSQLFDLAVFGHTHEVEVHREGRTLVVNPGECGGWLTGRQTVAIWNTRRGDLRIADL